MSRFTGPCLSAPKRAALSRQPAAASRASGPAECLGARGLKQCAQARRPALRNEASGRPRAGAPALPERSRLGPASKQRVSPAAGRARPAIRSERRTRRRPRICSQRVLA